MQCAERVGGGVGRHEATRCLLTSVKTGRTDATTHRAAAASSCAEISKKFVAALKRSTLPCSVAATASGMGFFFFIIILFSSPHWRGYLPNPANSDARCLHLLFFFCLDFILHAV